LLLFNRNLIMPKEGYGFILVTTVVNEGRNPHSVIT